MAVVLAGTGGLVYVRMDRELDRSIDAALRARATDVRGLVVTHVGDLGTSDGARLIEADESLVQLLGPDGRVVDETPGLDGTALVRGSDLERASHATVELGPRSVAGGDEPVRLLATPIRAGGEPLVLVVGASTGDRDEALASLRSQLLLGGPIALLLASGAGYLLAAAALRPVEAMRRRAETISTAGPAERLPVPRARDEVAQLATTLNAMLGRLDEAAARERRLVADASHELRRPLTLLKAELELAARGDRSRDELERTIRSAVEEVDGLAQLADDLLLITRADQGRLPIRPQPLEADDVLAGIARRYALRARLQGRKIVVDAASPTPLVADRLRLEQALGNLVENALRHGAGTIELRAGAVDGTVELSVSDDGPGLPAGFAPRAFERFTRGDPAREGGGAGLGLAIVDAIANAHGGQTRATARAPRGLTVSLEVPRRPPGA